MNKEIVVKFIGGREGTIELINYLYHAAIVQIRHMMAYHSCRKIIENYFIILINGHRSAVLFQLLLLTGHYLIRNTNAQYSQRCLARIRHTGQLGARRNDRIFAR